MAISRSNYNTTQYKRSVVRVNLLYFIETRLCVSATVRTVPEAFCIRVLSVVFAIRIEIEFAKNGFGEYI